MTSPLVKCAVVLICILLCASCSERERGKEENPLFLHPDNFDFSQNPQLLYRLTTSPHGYYRFINIPFAKLVCQRFKGSRLLSHSLNLHGDAHLEQYAVTDIGRGLSDFDDACSGPGIIDWMRFGVSLYLACYEQEWLDHYEYLFYEFFRGYQNALRDSVLDLSEPVIVQRLEDCFISDRRLYLQQIDRLIEPVPNVEKDSLLTAMQDYVESMKLENPHLDSLFFQIEKIGYLHIGIGSALDLKYLVRIRGNSDDPLDDKFLEIKQVRDLQAIPCINPGSTFDPFRILVGQARIAYEPFDFLGYFYYCQKTFWVHCWVDNYQEVDVSTTFKSVEELLQVVYDVGVQLGSGHTKQIAAPFDKQLRHKLLPFVDQHKRTILKQTIEFADLCLDAHRRFCQSISAARDY